MEGRYDISEDLQRPTPGEDARPECAGALSPGGPEGGPGRLHQLSRYGVHWKWAGRIVQVGQRLGTVEIWAGDERIAVHPRAQKPGSRFILPGQWAGLPRGDSRPRREAVAVQVPVGEVELRSLDVYELATMGGAR